MTTKSQIMWAEQNGCTHINGSGTGAKFIEPIVGDEVVLDIPDGVTWEGFWIGCTNISEKDKMFDYIIYDPVTGQPLVAGTDYTYHCEGYAVIFVDPMVGPAKFKMKKPLPNGPNMHVVLLPRQHGHHIFSEQVLQDLVTDAVGKQHPLKNLIADDALLMSYTAAKVISAEVTEKGVEAVVELGWF